MCEIEFATVDDVIKILQKVSANGCGNYLVGCNDEYYLAKKNEIPIINHSRQEIDLGGYSERVL